MSLATAPTTFERVLELLRDGRWHTEQELGEVAHFPRRWIDELKASGYDVQTSEPDGIFLVRLVGAESD